MAINLYQLIQFQCKFLVFEGQKKNTYFWHERHQEIIHPSRTTITLTIPNSPLTQYYCVMSDNLFTLLEGPHQKYLVVFPLNEIVSCVTIY